ncbi:hypothetical protein [Faecalibacter rhinopitheci]|uniref:Uncharacterized protein n=1 Tax=Faecalibacter rhinopitheci TaxID=2779678 RepID=A0A8J7G6C9_9FLAO|nr:hypothetical protein [Faecalibacter rhinopitheci]MBF0597602.1 hypothetical protein [Faecalibacter rhinopitheci]MBQ0148608.1 hypothetical protein [Candidatus Onthonaster equi]
MKIYFVTFLLVCSILGFAQKKMLNVFTIYNNEVILTGSDRMNLDQDRIDSIKILKGEESDSYFEKADGVILIYLYKQLQKEFITKSQINEILRLPIDRTIYVNGIKSLKEFKFSTNKNTIFEKIKIDGIYFANIVIQ